MTLSTIHTFLVAGLTSYQTGGTDWQIQSGVLVARNYDEVDKMNGAGKLVYGWLGAGRLVPRTSVFTMEAELPVFVRGRIIGDVATLEDAALQMTDDIIRAMIIGDGDASGEVYGRIEVTNFSEPLIDIETRSAQVLVIGKVNYHTEVQA